MLYQKALEFEELQANMKLIDIV